MCTDRMFEHSRDCLYAFQAIAWLCEAVTVYVNREMKCARFNALFFVRGVTLALLLAAVLLFPPSQFAATPSSATISRASPTLTSTAGPFLNYTIGGFFM